MVANACQWFVVAMLTMSMESLLEHLAHVFVLGGLAVLEVEGVLRGLLGYGLIDVDDGGYLGSLQAAELFDVVSAAAVHPDAGDLQAVVGALDLGVRGCRHRDGGASGGLKEVASMNHGHWGTSGGGGGGMVPS